MSFSRRKIIYGLSALAGILVVAYLLSKFTFQEIGTSLSSIDLSLVVAAFGIGIAANVVRALRLRVFFTDTPPFHILLGAFSLARALNIVLPARTGEIVSMVAFQSLKVVPSITEFIPIWLAIRINDLLALGVWFCLVITLGPLSENVQSLQWIMATAAAASLGLLLGMRVWGVAIFDRFQTQFFKERLLRIRQGLDRFSRGRSPFTCHGLSLVLWLGLLIQTAVIQQAAQSSLDFNTSITAAALVLAINLVPFQPPLALGTSELIWVGVLNYFGMGLEAAILVAISIRVINLALLLSDWIIGTLICSGQRSSPVTGS